MRPGKARPLLPVIRPSGKTSQVVAAA